MSALGRAASVLLAVATAATVVSLWLVAGVSARDIAMYTLGWLWTIVVPGWVLHRLIAGKQRDLLTDLALGAGVGVVASTFVWLLLVAVGWQSGYVAWPLLPILASIPRWRRVYEFGAFRRHLHPLTSAGLAFTTVFAITKLANGQWNEPLPPAASSWFTDSYWHLGIVYELQRSMPPQDPQFAGEAFWYHWFSNAHVAAQAEVAGVDNAVAFMQLWQPYLYAVVFALLVVAARLLTSRAWPGVVVCALAAQGSGVPFAWFSVHGTTVFNTYSPSQQYSLVPILLCLIGVIQLCRTPSRLQPTALFAIGALGSMGAKGSVLPTIICGVGLAFVVALLLDRARAKWLAGMTAIGVVTFGISLLLTSSANAGTHVQLFSTIRRLKPWEIFHGESLTSTSAVIPGLASAGGIVLLLLILVAHVVAYAAAWIGLPLLRRDVASWFLLGIGFAGFSAMMLVNQDGLSQVYFMSGAMSALLLLGAAGTYAAWERARTRLSAPTALLWVGVFASLGSLLAWISREMAGVTPEAPGLNSSIASGIATFVVGTAVLTGVAALLHRRLAWLAFAGLVLGAQAPWFQVIVNPPLAPVKPYVAPAIALAVCAVLLIVRALGPRIPMAAVTPVLVVLTLAAASLPITHTAGWLSRDPQQRNTYMVDADEAAAARWVLANVPEEDLIATNVHCTSGPEQEGCESRGFWVAGLTGHRVLLGAWAYTPAAHEAHGQDGRLYSQQPYEDPELYELNQRAFTDPTPEVLDELRSLGVDVLFASERHTDVSPELDELATEIHRNDQVVVYRIGEED